jgi:hypothetical protein
MVPVHRNKPKYSIVPEKNSYGLYKDELSSDFHKSCGYCDCPDFVWGGKAGFQIDHFAPKKQFPLLEKSYDNLIYSCPICNRGKSDKWPSDSPDISHKNGEGFIHPCSTSYDEHVSRRDNGEIYSKSSIGNYMIRTMKLGLSRHKIIWTREELRALILEVKKHIDVDSELKEKYIQLTDAFFQYDELLRNSIDKR